MDSLRMTGQWHRFHAASVAMCLAIVMLTTGIAGALAAGASKKADKSSSSANVEHEPRRWTDVTGKFSIVATLAKFDTTTVHLRKTDGTVVEVPLARLSEADQRFLRETQSRASSDDRVKKGSTGAEVNAEDEYRMRELAKHRRLIKGKLKRGRGDLFVVATSESTFHNKVKRTTKRLVVIDGQLTEETAREFRYDGYYPVPHAEFQIVEGYKKAVALLMDHVSMYIRKPLRKRNQAARAEPLPRVGDWRFIGRFDEREQAEAALLKAESAYRAQPMWEIAP